MTDYGVSDYECGSNNNKSVIPFYSLQHRTKWWRLAIYINGNMFGINIFWEIPDTWFLQSCQIQIQNSKKVYCCTRKYKSQFTNADINSHSVHGNGGKHAVCTFFICAHMLLSITYLLKNTDITQRIVCHAQQWGQRNPSGLMGLKSDTFNQVICSVHKGQSGKISQ